MKKKDEIRMVVEEFIGDKIYSFLNELDSNEFRDDLKDRLFDKKIDDQIDYIYTNDSSRVYGEKYKDLFIKELTEYILDKFKTQ